MAQNPGKAFEEDIKKSMPIDVYFYRLRDTASAFGGGSDFLRFSSQNHYDCFFYKYPSFYPCELKSNQGTSFSIQHTKEEKGKDIKLHQIEGLTVASQFPGIYAGLILNFRKTGNTYWLNIKDFNRFNELTEKKSINEKDVQEFGGIEIRSELKKVRYRYDINELIEKICEVII
jgi:penicillin-binding protein-related factor A (putative recombinase)